MNRPEIISDPKIMLGKPVIAGTRITVEFILEQLAAGETIEQIMDGYELSQEEVPLILQELHERSFVSRLLIHRQSPFFFAPICVSR